MPTLIGSKGPQAQATYGLLHFQGKFEGPGAGQSEAV
jgi:hypothetical protein